MNKTDGCAYCIPDENNVTKSLMTTHSFSRFDDNKNREKHIVDDVRIERDYRYSYSLDKINYILATHRKTYISESKKHILPTFEEKLLAINIVACPKCGRNLVDLDEDIRR